MAVIFK